MKVYVAKVEKLTKIKNTAIIATELDGWRLNGEAFRIVKNKTRFVTVKKR